MGYRSQVKILLTFSEELKRDVFFAKMSENLNFVGDLSESRTNHDNLNDGLFRTLYEFDNVKWYDSYVDVKAWTALMESINTDWKGVACEFIRVGENEGDVVHEGYASDDMNVDHCMYTSTSIEVDF